MRQSKPTGSALAAGYTHHEPEGARQTLLTQIPSTSHAAFAADAIPNMANTAVAAKQVFLSFFI
jgi:hypothetical protein